MDETVTYLGVKCKNCGSRIAIKPRTRDAQSAQFEAITRLVTVLCVHCGQTHEYGHTNEIHFEGPAPHR